MNGSFEDLTLFEQTLAREIWTASRADESTISTTGANVIAKALVRGGFVADPKAVDALQGALRGLAHMTTNEGGAPVPYVSSRSVRAAAERNGIPVPEWPQTPQPESRPALRIPGLESSP